MKTSNAVNPLVAGKPGLFHGISNPRVYVAIIGLSLIVLLPLASGSAFVVHLFVSICVFGGLATAWNIVGGYAGQLSLGHTVFYGLGAYTSALMLQHFGLSPWFSMLIGAALSAVFGIAIGYPCFRLRGPFFALSTIAFLEVVRLLALHFKELTNGAAGLIVPLRIGWEWMIFRDKMNYLFIAFGLLLLTLFVTFCLDRSRLGYYLTAVREREDAALAAGVPATRVKLIAVALSAALTSLIGSFHAMYLTFLEPGSMFSLATAVQIAMFALIGGLGTVSGPLAGALLIVPVSELGRAWLGAGATGLHGLVYGTVLVIMTLTLPRGLVGTFGDAVTRWIDRLPGGGRPAPEYPIAVPARTLPTGAGLVLEATAVSISFGGLVAADQISLSLHRGEILGVIGPNGAGKTTLFNLISGFLAPTSGRIAVISANGTKLEPRHPDQFARMGIGRTFQIVQPFGKLTVLDNILIGAFMNHSSPIKARAVARRVASLVGLDAVLDVEARNLPIGDLKRLEVARTLATEPTVLLLDEVMAGQSQADAQKMVALIHTIRQLGVSVIAIEHNMQAIMNLSDRIVVIDSGRVIAQGDPQAVVRERAVIEAYLGEDYVNAQGL